MLVSMEYVMRISNQIFAASKIVLAVITVSIATTYRNKRNNITLAFRKKEVKVSFVEE